MRVFLLLIGFVLLTAFTGQNVDQTVRLGSSSGILVTTLACGPDVFWFEVYPSGSYSEGYLGAFSRAAVVTCDEDEPLKTISLASGEYFIGKAGGMTFVDIDEGVSVKFAIKASALNYIGDIHLPTLRKQVGEFIKRDVVVVDKKVLDKRKEALSSLRARYPDLIERYPMVVDLASSLKK